MDEQIEEKQPHGDLQQRFINWAVARAQKVNSDLGQVATGQAVRRPETEIEAIAKTPQTSKVTDLTGLPPRTETAKNQSPTPPAKADWVVNGEPLKTTINYERFVR